MNLTSQKGLPMRSMRFENLSYLDIFRVIGSEDVYVKCVCSGGAARDSLGCVKMQPEPTITNFAPDVGVEFLGNLGKVMAKACR